MAPDLTFMPGQRARPALAGLGGVSGGTLLAALGQAVGPATLPGQLLIYIAPAVALGIGAALNYLYAQFQWRYELRSLAKSESILKNMLDDPAVSATRKGEVRALLDQLHRAKSNLAVQRVKLPSAPLASLGSAAPIAVDDGSVDP